MLRDSVDARVVDPESELPPLISDVGIKIDIGRACDGDGNVG